MILARQQSTTTYPIQFLLVLSSDSKTGATGKTPTVTASKNGASFGAVEGAVSELSNGVYSWAGNATDRNTLGELFVHVTAADCDPLDFKVGIVAYDPFATLAVNVTQFGGSNGTFISGIPAVNTTLVEGVQATDQIYHAVALALEGYDPPTNAEFEARTLAAADYGTASGQSAILTAIGEIEVDGGNVIITPLLASVANPFIATRDLPRMFAGSGNVIEWTITNGQGNAVDLSEADLRLVVYLIDSAGEDAAVFDDTLEGSFKYENESGGGLEVVGDNSNQVRLTHDPAKTATPGDYRYILWNLDTDIALARGRMPIEPSVKDVSDA